MPIKLTEFGWIYIFYFQKYCNRWFRMSLLYTIKKKYVDDVI